MPLWNQFLWNTPGTLWGPYSPAPPTSETRTHQRKTMKRKYYYPTTLGDQANWLGNFADKLATYQVLLGLSASQVTAGIADALYLKYAISQWLTDVRSYADSTTQAIDVLSYGTSSGNYILPGFTAPSLPPGDPAASPPVPATVPVKAGALTRIIDLVQIIKRSPGYEESIGLDLGIVGSEATSTATHPTFTLKTEGIGAGGCHCVKVRIKRFGHYAVALYSRRGTGTWELLGIAAQSLYEDERPLLTPGQPEIREYRAIFWDAGSENGEFSDPSAITVSP